MALNFFGLAGRSADVVGIFDESGAVQIFTGARAITATISQNIRYMKHPQEDGGNVTDHRIIEPVAINLNTILDPVNYRSTYQAIKAAAISSTLLTVQTKTDTFSNMVIAAFPSEESPALFDTISINFTLEEIQFEGARVQELPPEEVENPSDTSTVDRGTQNGTDTGPVDQGTGEDGSGSVLFDIFT